MRRLSLWSGLLLLAGCASHAPLVPEPQPPKVDGPMVTLRWWHFEPQRLIIQPGQTVTWYNNTQESHTLTSDPQFAAKSWYASVPPGVVPFTSPALAPQQTFSQTFTTPGTYRYFSWESSKLGMVGEITVLPPSSSTGSQHIGLAE